MPVKWWPRRWGSGALYPRKPEAVFQMLGMVDDAATPEAQSGGKYRPFHVLERIKGKF